MTKAEHARFVAQPAIDSVDGHADCLVPAQLIPVRGYHALPGEARLALAVLEDAVMTLRKAAGVHTARAHRLATEARTWFVCRDATDPFAFENVCDQLGLDAAWIREAVLRADYGCARTPLRRVRRTPARPYARAG